MRIANDLEKERRGEETVTIVNAGDRVFTVTFGNRDFPFPPRSERTFIQRMAWLWLGDPDLRPGETNTPTFGTEETWRNQIEKLKNRYGSTKTITMLSTTIDGPPTHREEPDPDSAWAYLMDGKFYCREWAKKWGKGKEFYRIALASPRVADTKGFRPMRSDDDVPDSVDGFSPLAEDDHEPVGAAGGKRL